MAPGELEKLLDNETSQPDTNQMLSPFEEVYHYYPRVVREFEWR